MIYKILSEAFINNTGKPIPYLPYSPINTRKFLLTSNGFKNPNIAELFLNTINKDPNKIKILFIDIENNSTIVSYYKNELYNIGILKVNIDTITDIRNQSVKYISTNYNSIYIVGENSNYLINTINNTNFRNVLLTPIKDYSIYYIGVSAGSTICDSNLPNNLGILANPIIVHCKDSISSSNPGKFRNSSEAIRLNDNQAIWINNRVMKIVQ